MPIYEYECQSCGHRHEALQKVSDDPLQDCPACNQPELKKMLTAAAFKLTGTGWYETDFKNKDKSSGKKSNEESGGASSADPSGAKATASNDGNAKAKPSGGAGGEAKGASS